MGDEDQRAFVDSMADPEAVRAFGRIDEADEHTALRATLAALPDDEREVLEARASGEHQRDVCTRLDLSRDRLRQLESQAAAKVRRVLAA